MSLVGFTLLYGFLGVVDFYLIFKNARKGPEDDTSTFIVNEPAPAIKSQEA
jgi:cytochrome d ubiquinol oxidase subunit I